MDILALNRRLLPKNERFGGAREALYWLRLLSSDPLVGDSVAPLITEANEWVALLTTTVKKLRS